MAGEWNQASFAYDPVGQAHTFDFILDKIESALTQSGWERPSWDTGLLTIATSSTAGVTDETRYFIRTDRNTQDRWRFTGDNLLQHGGIAVSYEAASDGAGVETGPQIVIHSFLEDSTATGVQVHTPDEISGSGADFRFGTVRISIDNFTVNNWLLYLGEDGIYLESGANGVNTNLGHGAVMTFGSIPELHGTRDEAVQWTAQGLIVDMTRNCKFTATRSDRFVTNDGTDKNFTASLQPVTPRGTRNIDSVAGNVVDGKGYYLGSRDTFMSMGVGVDQGSAQDTAGTSVCSARFAATFGLFNTPKNDRFRIPQLMMIQELHHHRAATTSTSSSNNLAPSANSQMMLDVRTYRQVFRFAAADYTLLPFVNVTESVTGTVYRIARIDDNGRFSQIGIEVPATTLTLP